MDYALAADASGPVTLEIVETGGGGRVVRSYSSDDPVLDPDPALDPASYDRVCRKNPSATDCGLPLYWPAPQARRSTRAGLHRFTWDMRYQPVGDVNLRAAGEVEATGAVPHRGEHSPSAPWAPPGRYLVRLRVDGTSYTQPLTLRLDPRVKTPAVGLRRLATLTREMYDAAARARGAYREARALVDSLSGTMRAQLESLAPAPRPQPRGFARPVGPTPTPTLERASNAALAAAMAMQDADVAPTAAQVAACARARAQVNQVLARWTRLKAQRR